MSQLSKYLRSIEGGGLAFWCQGCKKHHLISVGEGPGPRWSWNGDAERPVFSPSILGRGWRLTDAGENALDAWCAAGCPEPEPTFESAEFVCHSFVGCNGAQPGEIIFLSDCTHALAGTVQPLAELPTRDQAGPAPEGEKGC